MIGSNDSNFQESQVQKLVGGFNPSEEHGWNWIIWKFKILRGENQQKSLQPPPSTTSWLFVKPRLADALPPGLGQIFGDLFKGRWGEGHLFIRYIYDCM